MKYWMTKIKRLGEVSILVFLEPLLRLLFIFTTFLIILLVSILVFLEPLLRLQNFLILAAAHALYLRQ